MKHRKKRISHKESIRLRIEEVKAEIDVRVEHFKYLEETNKFFPKNAHRIIGEDTRRYIKDHPVLCRELKSLEKYYNEKFKENGRDPNEGGFNKEN